MLPDLEHLIQLQRLDDSVTEARRILAEHPARVRALDDRLAGARDRVAREQERAAANQAARRALEKDLAAVQGRLSRFKDQLMEVKTNREYQAMQKEIETAQHDIAALEDQMLERLLEADDLAGALRQAETDLRTEQAAIDSERREMETRAVHLKEKVERAGPAREGLVASLPPQALALFEQVARSRRGVAIARAQGGHCTVCHVRLRPQVFNDIRCNESIIQCDSCQRILYFDGEAESGEGAAR